MTLAGVVMTIEDQHKVEREERRIANMPVLSFDVMNASDTNGDRILTILENKRLSTSAFIQINGKGYCNNIEGNHSEYFRYPEYKNGRTFAGTNLDIQWLLYNFALILLKLQHLDNENK